MGMERTVLSGQNSLTAQKNFVYPNLAKDRLEWLQAHPVRTTVVQLVGSKSLKPYVEKMAATKDLKSRKIAHQWTGERRFQVAPHVQGNTVAKIPAKLIVPAGDFATVVIADRGTSHIILPSTALATNNKDTTTVTLRLGQANV